MANIKVVGGTAKTDENPLCLSCKYAVMAQGANLKQRQIICNVGVFGNLNRTVQFDVYNCSAYMNSNHPYIHEMEELAWIIKTDVRTNQIGFTPINKLSWEERQRLKIGSPGPVVMPER